MIKIFNINNINYIYKYNNKFVYIIFSNDNFIKIILKKLLIIKIIENTNKNIIINNYYVNNKDNLYKIINNNLNIDIFNKKIIKIIHINNKNILNNKEKYILNKYNNNIIIILLNFYINKFIKKLILNIFNNNYTILIEEYNISYKKFLFFIKIIFNKNKLYFLNSYFCVWLYLIYKNNFIDIFNIINFIEKNKLIKIDSNYIYKLSEVYLYNFNYSSWIYLSILKYKELLNFSLLMLRNSNIKYLLISLRELQNNIFFVLFNKKKNLNYINKLDINYKNKLFLLKYLYNIDINILYNIISIIYDIEIYIKEYNIEYNNIIYNKFDLISILLYNKTIYK